MYSATNSNYKWVNYVILLALIGFILLMILANVKSKSYYQNVKVSKKPALNSASRSITPLRSALTSARTQDCNTKSCIVTCSGDMTNLNKYLQSVKGCTSYTLRISEATFPNDRLQSNWLQCNLIFSLIQIKLSTLREIENGAFNHDAAAKMIELELNGVQLQSLTENTFVGLKAMETFTLINRIQEFSGDGFLTPMEKTLKKIVIKHVTSIPTDPAPWLRGGSFTKLMTIVFDGSNLGGYIEAATFEHIKGVYYIMLNSCKITYIADGAFNFLMNKYLFLVSLQNNQLKRLGGEYLTKVAPLKGIDIQNNPWDCTCELEELIREFKKFPNGFGNTTECRTPPKFAGKVLDTVDVERCEDTTTTVVSTPTTKATTPSTSSSSTIPTDSDPTTITSTVMPPGTPPDSTIEPPASTYETSSESTLSTVTMEQDPSTIPMDSPPSTGFTDIPINTTNEVLSPEPDISTTSPTSIGTSDSYTTDLASPTTAFTTLSDDGVTIPPPQTTPSPQNRTTTLSEDTIFVECQRYTIESAQALNEPEFFVELSRPDTHFGITSLSRTSAQLQIENPTDDLALIWFYDQPNTSGSGESLRIVGEFKMGCQSDLEDLLVIEGLVQKRAYTFCLVRVGIQVISPFNCLSFCSSAEGIGVIDESEVWLKCEDRPLTIGLLIFGIVISICIGIVSMYMLLRFYPSLLKGSKRVIVVNRSTGDVLILPRPCAKASMTDTEYCYNNSLCANTTIRQRRFSETSIQSGLSYMVANNYEDIEYRWKMNVVNDMIYANRVPKSPAPPLPKRVSQDKSLSKDNEDKMKVAVVLPKGNDYGYIA